MVIFPPVVTCWFSLAFSSCFRVVVAYRIVVVVAIVVKEGPLSVTVDAEFGRRLGQSGTNHSFECLDDSQLYF